METESEASFSMEWTLFINPTPADPWDGKDGMGYPVPIFRFRGTPKQMMNQMALELADQIAREEFGMWSIKHPGSDSFLKRRQELVESVRWTP